MREKALSWGRYFRYPHTTFPLEWSGEEQEVFQSFKGSLLPYGLGRSYGDSCLNARDGLLSTRGLNRFLQFDEEAGVLRCEAGVPISDILKLIVPRGWFLPVTPGTQFVTVGGMIANDCHGKNHHRAGTFGRHVRCFELAHSDGGPLRCSPTENVELFRATIGGMGLTGLIRWAEFSLKPIESSEIEVESIRYGNLDEFFDLSRDSERTFEYTVSWVDCLAAGKSLGRGLFLRGNHAKGAASEKRRLSPRVSVPVEAFGFALNPWSLRLFNSLYYHK